MTSGRKFSTITSAEPASSRARPRSCSSVRSSTTLCLLRLTDWKYVARPCASNGGPQLRVSSPVPGRSTLITSAPRSASIIVANGPARIREKSRIRSSPSGGMSRGLSSTRAILNHVTA